jgi:threonine dehydrogenase-like Zn-dependent dehydrogenase
MQALTTRPGHPNSAMLEEVPPPPIEDGAILVRTKAIGICGTDMEIINGRYGAAPPDTERLILGHESIGTVEEAPADSGFAKGDLVVGIVRRPDPIPCAACSAGEWDMCRNGLYTERGIKKRQGYGSDHYRIEPGFAVKVDAALGVRGVLLEPASIVAKAWDHIERIGRRAAWTPECVLVTGAGPVGLLAALMGVQRGFQVHVFDRTQTGPKPDLVRDLGATYHAGDIADLNLRPDIVLECTGASSVVLAVINQTAPGSIVCLAGVSSGERVVSLDLGLISRSMVLENDVLFGSVNANRRHFELGADSLRRAEPAWLDRLISRRVPLARWRSVLKRGPDDVKVVIDFEE